MARAFRLRRLPAPTNVSGVTRSADARLWHDGTRGVWRLILSGMTVGGAPPVLLHYESKSLVSGWKYTGVLYTAHSGANRMECPSYTRFANGTALLVFSWPHRGYDQFWVSGVEDPHTSAFTPKQSGQLEFGVGYAGAMTAAWPGRLLSFSWMRGVSDGSSYVGAQSLPRELNVHPDYTVTISAAVELEKLLKQPTTTEHLVAPSSGETVAFKHRVPQQACLRINASASGPRLPANAGITLVNEDGAVADSAPQLQLEVVISAGGACLSLPHAGCMPIAPPSVEASGAWTMALDATLWLDNGLVEMYTTGGSAVLSAFVPALFGDAPLGGSVGATENATASFGMSWNEVASA